MMARITLLILIKKAGRPDLQSIGPSLPKFKEACAAVAIGAILGALYFGISFIYSHLPSWSEFTNSFSEIIGSGLRAIDRVDPNTPSGKIFLDLAPKFLQWAGALAIAASIPLLKRLMKFRRLTGESANSISQGPANLVAALDAIIQKSVDDGPEMAVVNAKAIVAARNDISVIALHLGKSLNSEIDELSQSCGSASPDPQFGFSRPHPPAPCSDIEVYRALRVLHAAWPVKRLKVESAAREMLALMRIQADTLGERPPSR